MNAIPNRSLYMWSKNVPNEEGLFLVYYDTSEKEGWGTCRHKTQLMKAEFYHDPQQRAFHELLFYPQYISKESSTRVYPGSELKKIGCLFSKFEIPVQEE